MTVLRGVIGLLFCGNFLDLRFLVDLELQILISFGLLDQVHIRSMLFYCSAQVHIRSMLLHAHYQLPINAHKNTQSVANVWTLEHIVNPDGRQR